MNNCKICNNEVEKIFQLNILHKYPVWYYRCIHCEFVQTENPYWLAEAYNIPVATMDTGILQRNLSLLEKTMHVIDKNFDSSKRFMEYAGGYGIFTRLMRDNGFDFYFYDQYCESIFAKPFDIGKKWNVANEKYEVITAFSVFEHFVDPLKEIARIFKNTDCIVFTEELIPINLSPDWWFLIPECGQHVSFYSIKTLQKISADFGCYLYSNGFDYHAFTKRKLGDTTFFKSPNRLSGFIQRAKLFIYKRKRINKKISLTQKDFEMCKEKLQH